MNNFNHIQQKLQHFIKKYYTNEIIKGSILFLSFGLLYFIFTLFVEYFLWLKPIARTILFWVFILVEISLLTIFILLPIFKLMGLKKGISLKKASQIIGYHFKEVDDKLLNILQLNDFHENRNDNSSDLLLASIEQKAKNLQPIPFKKAINFKVNIKYIKYLSIPIIIWLFTFLTGNNSIFTQSLDRIVHYKTVYSPPAPFHFKVLNKYLKTIEGNSFMLQIETIGDIIPENVSIHFKNESYYLKKDKIGAFNYTFEIPNQNIDFYFESNNVFSKIFTLKVLAAPKIIDFKMFLNYPSYTGKKSEIIKNTGNATLPEGTHVTWKITSKNTDNIYFVNLNNALNTVDDKLDKNKNAFEITKKIKKNISYQVTTSNRDLKKFEKLDYQLKVIKDQFPSIIVKSDIDSITRGSVQFFGRLSDDYGIKKLQVVAKNLNSNTINIANIEVGKSDFEEFFYLFPDGLILGEGTNYEIYFEVFDNDGINGSKKSTSKYFYYNNKTQQEINDEILLEQKQSIDDIQNATKKAKDFNKALEDFNKKLKNKTNNDWNDKKEWDQFLERQQQYQKMLEKNSDKLLQNLEEMEKEENSDLEEKKQNLKKRIEENQELQKKQDLLKELQELAEKLKKEDLLNKIDKLTEQNKQETRSLERILELTKRFYVEKKSAQIINKLEKLSEEQLKLSAKENISSNKQNELNKKFDSIQKDFQELNKQNKALKQPLDIQDTKADEKSIQMQMKEAAADLNRSQESKSKSAKEVKQSAKKNQKGAAKKMQDLSKKLEANFMQMEAEGNEENIKDLQQILDNLITFSFDQEELMLGFKEVDSKNSQYPKMLKQQIRLKEHFEHIDDSLFTLSLRLVRLSSKIQNDITEAHYNLDKSLENITENRIKQGVSNQQYTMTAANNLADLLSDILQNLQSKKPGSGKGKGKSGDELSLPDIIKKQGKLVKKMKEGIKPGDKSGSNSFEKMSGEQFQIYQEQNRLKEHLNQLLKQSEINGNQAKKVLQQMEALEKLLLEKGITNESIARMQKLEHELLKLDNAVLHQNKDKKRKSNTNSLNTTKRRIKPIPSKQLFLNQDEILIRQNFRLQPLYQDKIKEYFKNKV
ncbi:MAG: DUF4175 family protein [Flavobacteriaceae bacterium]|nr:DUF4175 family protein [Flavobacteriaceae bacterium]